MSGCLPIEIAIDQMEVAKARRKAGDVLGSAVMRPRGRESAFPNRDVVRTSDRVLSENARQVIVGCPGQSLIRSYEQARSEPRLLSVEDPQSCPTIVVPIRRNLR